MKRQFLAGKVTLYGGDSRDVLRELADSSIDSICTDPPYALVSIPGRRNNTTPTKPDDQYRQASCGFRGETWDTGETAFASEFWRQCYRVLKPGGHVVSFGGTRTYHRLVCAIEDAGFEIRDMLAWLYGTGFPKSRDVSKAIDKALGHADDRGYIETTGGLHGGSGNTVGSFTGRQLSDVPFTEEACKWHGFGTALKPAHEPICLARKPLIGTVAANVMEFGTAALNIDGCRIATDELKSGIHQRKNSVVNISGSKVFAYDGTKGRWPANVCHDGSEDVVAAFPGRQSMQPTAACISDHRVGVSSSSGLYDVNDDGSAARFFFSAKASESDRFASTHPTVKPVLLMQWLCRLVTPPGGTVLDPFAGSGTTGEAAWREGFSSILIEREEDYQADIAFRLSSCDAGPVQKQNAMIKKRGELQDVSALPLFGSAANDNVSTIAEQQAA
jgi:site-specific DNA-methyltransferase (adenine-specific)